jgi:hypothetical protein
MLPCYMLDSYAWHVLSPHARLAYLEVARLYNGSNNGRLAMSARRLASLLPCNKDTAARALRELEDVGSLTPSKSARSPASRGSGAPVNTD